ncbi:EscU/YscU/HrcU family type III secretion system export apparatus switch protein [Salinisphaera sp. Q1T1-3]|uniref:EscU/YscU/HrcU family type III secretion system export apparatus switch protein n=1 Tax=Salinisphaera sp. Q1T1-3 TaxID=2321229 RepID=UPI000E71D04B|nr:EscU/YscU/HrcU family type III secretion system export apparatus switch protein [Salinisphaera sp. Q1T1-3]RJS95192.1 flagellar protein FhlB [Salinisphaera sp. Q1T1-3]
MSDDEPEHVADESPSASARRHAVALRYETGDDAPRVVAKGYGDIADAIIARAETHDLPVHADRELVRLLAQVDLDAHIPPALYVAVAELLAWVYELDRAANH